MEKSEGRSIYRIVRDFLFSAANKEFLIFLFFLIASGAFWLLLALNEDTDQELLVPIRLTNIPKNVVVTTNTEDTIHVNVRDKGFFIMAYVYGGKLWAENADKKALRDVNIQKGAGFSGKIEYSSDKSTWSETVDADAKYVRAGY